MNTIFVKALKYMLLLLTITAGLLTAQTGESYRVREVSNDSLMIYARAIVDSARCRVLVTVDEEGKPHAREMSPFRPEDNWVIWLGTSPVSRKVKQIEKNPNVVVLYYDTKGLSYVSVSGKAHLINDPDLKNKYWVKGWEQFYPDRDTGYILIKVVPEKLGQKVKLS